MIKLPVIRVGSGAPLECPSVQRPPRLSVSLTLELEYVPLINGDYDYPDRYWGSGPALYCYAAYDDESSLDVFGFIRADCREHAMACIRMLHPNVHFAPETGRIINQTIKALDALSDRLDPSLHGKEISDIESAIDLLWEDLYDIWDLPSSARWQTVMLKWDASGTLHCLSAPGDGDLIPF